MRPSARGPAAAPGAPGRACSPPRAHSRATHGMAAADAAPRGRRPREERRPRAAASPPARARSPRRAPSPRRPSSPRRKEPEHAGGVRAGARPYTALERDYSDAAHRYAHLYLSADFAKAVVHWPQARGPLGRRRRQCADRVERQRQGAAPCSLSTAVPLRCFVDGLGCRRRARRARAPGPPALWGVRGTRGCGARAAAGAAAPGPGQPGLPPMAPGPAAGARARGGGRGGARAAARDGRGRRDQVERAGAARARRCSPALCRAASGDPGELARRGPRVQGRPCAAPRPRGRRSRCLCAAAPWSACGRPAPARWAARAPDCLG